MVGANGDVLHGVQQGSMLKKEHTLVTFTGILCRFVFVLEADYYRLVI